MPARAEALPQLQAWAAELGKVAQGHGEDHRAKVQAVATDEFMRHPEHDVRLWAAKCLAEALRIFAPDPPLSDKQRRAALALFLEQLGGLAADSRSPTFMHALGLLEQLTEIRAFMLLFECEGQEQELLTSLTAACLAAARADEGGVLEGPLSRLLADVLGECDDIPKAVLRALVEEFAARRRPSAPPSRSAGLVRRVLGGLAQRSAVLAVNEFLIRELWSGAGSTAVQGEDAEAEQELEEVAESSRAAAERRDALFRAVYELFEIDPLLVGRVLPHLHADMLCKDARRRRAVTALVGRLLAHVPTGGGGGAAAAARVPLVKRNPELFDRHMERLGDADEGVRLAALDGAKELILAAAACQSPGVVAAPSAVADSFVLAAEAAREQLRQRCLDPSEEVRLKTVGVAAETATSSPAAFALMAPALPEIFGRILDKKPKVREACAEAAARLYAKHALPEILAGRPECPEELAWVPQLLCEAFHVFAQGRFGHSAQLEEYIEQHVLGCGAPGADAGRRARALAAFCSAALGREEAARGLTMLLARKRDSNAALRRFLQLRVAKGGPVLEFNQRGSAAPVAGNGGAAGADGPKHTVQVDIRRLALCLQNAPANGDEDASAIAAAAAVAAGSAAITALEELARLSPATEDRNARPETLLVHLRVLDAVRDRALWSQLDRLTRATAAERTEDMPGLLAELDRLLRTHRLTELGAMLRRALLSTWLLPEHVPTLLEAWDTEAPSAAAPAGRPSAGPARRRSSRRGDGVAGQAGMAAVLGKLPKFFAGAFLPHADAVAAHLSDPAAEHARVALLALAAVGKHAAASAGTGDLFGSADWAPSALDVGRLVADLLHVVDVVGSAESVLARSALSRKAVRTLALLPAAGPWAAAEKMLRWAYDRCAAALQHEDALPQDALHLAAACIEWSAERPGRPDDVAARAGADDWRAFVRSAATQADAPAESLCAAAELCLAAGAAAELGALLRKAAGIDVALQLQLAALVLRPLRRGTVPLTNSLLTEFASFLCTTFTVTSSIVDADVLVEAFQKLQKPVVVRVRLADRLRLCVTLPTTFALAPSKKHRDAVQRMLQASMLKASRQSTVRREPLLEYAVACFIHFLSRLDPFLEEAGAAASAFPQSSKVSEVFCDALLKCEPSKGLEHAACALRVCDRVRFFEDVDRPGSNAIHKAASVLRHVVEKHCPELGKQAQVLMQGAPRGSMPAELYAHRQAFGASSGPAALQQGAAAGQPGGPALALPPSQALSPSTPTPGAGTPQPAWEALGSSSVASVARPMASRTPAAATEGCRPSGAAVKRAGDAGGVGGKLAAATADREPGSQPAGEASPKRRRDA